MHKAAGRPKGPAAFPELGGRSPDRRGGRPDAGGGAGPLPPALVTSPPRAPGTGWLNRLRPARPAPGAFAALLGALLRVMVAAEEGVRPGARPLEAVVLDDHRRLEHRLLLAVGLQPLVGLRPDALPVVDLAEPLARAAAGAVALILGADRLRTDVGDVGQRAVAAVPAVEDRHLRRLLELVERLAEWLRRLLDALVEAPARVE